MSDDDRPFGRPHRLARAAAVASCVALFASSLGAIFILTDIDNFHKHSYNELEEFKTLAEDAWSVMQSPEHRPPSSSSSPPTKMKRYADAPGIAPPREACASCAEGAATCPRGPPGPRGRRGPAGPNAPDGQPGSPGVSAMRWMAQMMPGCVQCPRGRRGPQGPPGPPGKQGYPGYTGYPGRTGSNSRRGSPGVRGDKGPPGPQGRQGDRGPKGRNGRKGRGPRGPAGPTGARGRPGLPGPRGHPGYNGRPGRIGRPGELGHRGRKGPEGTAGKPGRIGPPGEKPQCECGGKEAEYEANGAQAPSEQPNDFDKNAQADNYNNPIGVPEINFNRPVEREMSLAQNGNNLYQTGSEAEDITSSKADHPAYESSPPSPSDGYPQLAEESEENGVDQPPFEAPPEEPRAAYGVVNRISRPPPRGGGYGEASSTLAYDQSTANSPSHVPRGYEAVTAQGTAKAYEQTTPDSNGYGSTDNYEPSSSPSQSNQEQDARPYENPSTTTSGDSYGRTDPAYQEPATSEAYDRSAEDKQPYDEGSSNAPASSTGGYEERRPEEEYDSSSAAPIEEYNRASSEAPYDNQESSSVPSQQEYEQNASTERPYEGEENAGDSSSTRGYEELPETPAYSHPSTEATGGEPLNHNGYPVSTSSEEVNGNDENQPAPYPEETSQDNKYEEPQAAQEQNAQPYEEQPSSTSNVLGDYGTEGTTAAPYEAQGAATPQAAYSLQGTTEAPYAAVDSPSSTAGYEATSTEAPSQPTTEEPYVDPEDSPYAPTIPPRQRKPDQRVASQTNAHQEFGGAAERGYEQRPEPPRPDYGSAAPTSTSPYEQQDRSSPAAKPEGYGSPVVTVRPIPRGHGQVAGHSNGGRIGPSSRGSYENSRQAHRRGSSESRSASAEGYDRPKQASNGMAIRQGKRLGSPRPGPPPPPLQPHRFGAGAARPVEQQPPRKPQHNKKSHKKHHGKKSRHHHHHHRHLYETADPGTTQGYQGEDASQQPYDKAVEGDSTTSAYSNPSSSAGYDAAVGSSSTGAYEQPVSENPSTSNYDQSASSPVSEFADGRYAGTSKEMPYPPQLDNYGASSTNAPNSPSPRPQDYEGSTQAVKGESNSAGYDQGVESASQAGYKPSTSPYETPSSSDAYDPSSSSSPSYEDAAVGKADQQAYAPESTSAGYGETSSSGAYDAEGSSATSPVSRAESSSSGYDAAATTTPAYDQQTPRYDDNRASASSPGFGPVSGYESSTAAYDDQSTQGYEASSPYGPPSTNDDASFPHPAGHAPSGGGGGAPAYAPVAAPPAMPLSGPLTIARKEPPPAPPTVLIPTAGQAAQHFAQQQQPLFQQQQPQQFQTQFSAGFPMPTYFPAPTQGALPTVPQFSNLGYQPSPHYVPFPVPVAPPVYQRERIVIDAKAAADGGSEHKIYTIPSRAGVQQHYPFLQPPYANPFQPYAVQRHASFSISTQDMKRRIEEALRKQAAENAAIQLQG